MKMTRCALNSTDINLFDVQEANQEAYNQAALRRMISTLRLNQMLVCAEGLIKRKEQPMKVGIQKMLGFVIYQLFPLISCHIKFITNLFLLYLYLERDESNT